MYRVPVTGRDTTLAIVNRWIDRAAEALQSNWDEEKGNFWRDSWRDQAEVAEAETEDPPSLGRGKGATSNNRSFQALVSAAQYFSTNPGALAAHANKKLSSQLTHAAQQMMEKYFSLELKQIREHGENRDNVFTDSQLLLSISLALSPITSQICQYQLSEQELTHLHRHLIALADIVSGKLKGDGVRVHDMAKPHHFLTLHAVRALDAANRIRAGQAIDVPDIELNIEKRPEYSDLLRSVREEIVHQLGLHMLPAPGYDSSSLVSSCALLRRFTGDADSPLIHRAVEALVEDQSERGTWSSAGTITYQRRKVVYMPSIELSLALCNLVQMDLLQGESDMFDLAVPALDASVRLIQSSFSRHEEAAGWGNDRTRSGNEVESWTTAVVLRYLLSYREALTTARQEQILQKYKAERTLPDFASFWADLGRAIPDAERQAILHSGVVPKSRLARFTRLTDPTADNSIVHGVTEEILKPVLRSVTETPVDCVSFLLYGPPGTRKTTFVEEMASALRWPLLTLSPPAFLSNGIEGFEAAADDIFEELLHLQRVVVLFDECEEFFRWRSSPTTVESRTIGAFITSGMLPRLQALRKARSVIFVINTNIEAYELDDAVTRRGRLDRAARVGHPLLPAQKRYLEKWESRISGKTLTEEHTSWFTRLLNEVETAMQEPRERLTSEREKAQKSHPDRGEGYRALMTTIRQDEAKELTKVVTFGMLDELAERCLGEGTQTPIESEESLSTNLEQEFERFGPDKFHSVPNDT